MSVLQLIASCPTQFILSLERFPGAWSCDDGPKAIFEQIAFGTCHNQRTYCALSAIFSRQISLDAFKTHGAIVHSCLDLSFYSSGT